MAKDEEIIEDLQEETAEDEQEAEACSETAEEVTEQKEDGEATETEESESEEKKKSIFKKKEKKDKKDEQIEELTDKVKRQMAEFENFRRRTEKEKSQMFDMGAKTIIEKMLPVIDNFERGLAAVTEDTDKAFAEGMDMIYKQMLSVLAEAGVQPIEVVGQEFDPDFHNAVMHIEDEEQGENIIVEEFQKGYLYRDTVVRHSMVKVAN